MLILAQHTWATMSRERLRISATKLHIFGNLAKFLSLFVSKNKKHTHKRTLIDVSIVDTLQKMYVEFGEMTKKH